MRLSCKICALTTKTKRISISAVPIDVKHTQLSGTASERSHKRMGLRPVAEWSPRQKKNREPTLWLMATATSSTPSCSSPYRHPERSTRSSMGTTLPARPPVRQEQRTTTPSWVEAAAQETTGQTQNGGPVTLACLVPRPVFPGLLLHLSVATPLRVFFVVSVFARLLSLACCSSRACSG